MQRGGNRLRVNVQLIDAETGNHLWAERFDKPVADLFDMQDEIVSRLANTLDAELDRRGGPTSGVFAATRTRWTWFPGQGLVEQGADPRYMAQARGFFEKALALDPDNVEAMVGLARVDCNAAATYDRRLVSAICGGRGDFNQSVIAAPNHAVAHMLLGAVQIFTKRAAQGIAECEHALALDRNLASAHALIGLRQVSSWSRRRDRSSYQRGAPPFSSRHLGLSMDGIL